MTELEERSASIDSNSGTGISPGSSPLLATRTPTNRSQPHHRENIFLCFRVADDELTNRLWRLCLLQLCDGAKRGQQFRRLSLQRSGMLAAWRNHDGGQVRQAARENARMLADVESMQVQAERLHLAKKRTDQQIG